MTERYYERVYDEEYYILDSNVISPEAFDERVEYEGYTAFGDSMSGAEIVRLLNENEQLKLEKETLMSNYQREIQSSIDFCNTYSKTNGKLLDEIEQLKKENQGIQDKVMRLLDYVELKQCVTRTEIKKWWNGDVE